MAATRPHIPPSAARTAPRKRTVVPRRRRGIVVMKFGGTSVADADKIMRVASLLVAAKQRGDEVVGVLSAMGSTTDELLTLARRIAKRPDPRELDMLISVGEHASCALCALAVHDLGHRAISFSGGQAGILTNGVHGKARIVEIRPDRVREALAQDQIVLVAGFQGVSALQDVTTLGRGGSDTTAVALAAALGAEACEIYSDVDGVFTADPRIVPTAQKVHALSYDEMLELASSGAKVLQLRSVEIARNHGIKLHVRSTFSDDHGTWIVDEDDRMLEQAMISGVTHMLAETVYRTQATAPADLLAVLAEADVNVDTILKTNGDVVFSAPADERHDVEAALEGARIPFSARDDLGKVSVVGAGMRTHPGIAARVFAALAAESVVPELVTTSPIKVSCHVARKDVIRATTALHEEFALSRSSLRHHE